jgi:hypothetical protein
MEVSYRAVDVVVEVAETRHKVPHPIVRGMEDVSAIPMHLDVVDTLRVAVAGDVAAAFDDEAAFAMSVGLMSEDSAKKTSSDNDIIVLFHD